MLPQPQSVNAYLMTAAANSVARAHVGAANGLSTSPLPASAAREVACCPDVTRCCTWSVLSAQACCPEILPLIAHTPPAITMTSASRAKTA